MIRKNWLGTTTLALAALLLAGPTSLFGQDYMIEFSQDIGADTELSDPFFDGDEAFDPGDVYWWQSAPVVPPGRDGFKDDFFIFNFDPWPDPPNPGTAVPVGNGSIEDYYEYFDLDGHDQIDFSLHDVQYPYQMVPSQCVHEAYFLLLSFDDDMAPGWPANDVPVNASSPAGVSSYGTTAGRDEVVGVNLMITGGLPPYPIQLIYPFADELTIHGSMQPNPDFAEEDDDDVDSLDIVESEEVCPYWYFSPDHEAHYGLDPGGVYLVTGMGPVQVIDEPFHLGISEDTDIDAFEFVWLENPDEPGMILLALIYSVDEDDPLTMLTDESGGMIPSVIYASFMTGYSFQLIAEDLWDDVDALTAWRDPLNKTGCPNPGASGNYCLADCYPNTGDGIWDYAVDGDCIVDLSDLGQLLPNYGTTTGMTREDGDVYPPGVGNGAVDLSDLGELLAQYGDNCN